MSDFQPKPREKNIFDDRKLKLYAPSPSGRGRASLNLSVFNGNPRMTVWTGNDNEKDKGRVDAKLDLLHFNAFRCALEDAIAFQPTAERPEYRWRMDIGFPKGQGQFTITADLFVGQDKEGRVYVSVVSRTTNTAVKFVFANAEFHNMYHAGSERFSEAEASKLMARAYLKVLELVPAKCAETWVDNSNKPQGGGNQGGGYNRGGGNGGGGYNGGGNGGGYNRQPANDDDSEPNWA